MEDDAAATWSANPRLLILANSGHQEGFDFNSLQEGNNGYEQIVLRETMGDH